MFDVHFDHDASQHQVSAVCLSFGSLVARVFTIRGLQWIQLVLGQHRLQCGRHCALGDISWRIHLLGMCLVVCLFTKVAED